MSNISITSGMRANLQNLQTIAAEIEKTQTRLATGKKVNSALDDAVSFFSASSFNNRADDLASLKNSMSNAIQTIKAADTGILNITTLINSARAIAISAKTSTDKADLEQQFDSIMKQIEDVAVDSGYGGNNLLSADTLSVSFNPSGTNVLTVTGTATTATSIAGKAIVAADFGDSTGIDAAISSLDLGLSALRAQGASLGANFSIISVRDKFTTEMISVLRAGADNLVLADMNEESANLLMLQTRQSLSTTALSLASQSAQSILKLFT